MFRKRDREKEQIAMISRYRTLFNSEDGKKVLSDLLKVTNVLGDNFDPNPSIHAYNEGARSIVLRILRTINTDPDMLAQHMKGQLEENYEI